MKYFHYPRNKRRIWQLFETTAQRDVQVRSRVQKIIDQVRERGDDALIELTARFDRVELAPQKLRLPPELLKESWQSLPRPLKIALRIAKERIVAFHRHQVPKSWTIHEEIGTRLSQRMLPLKRVGVYVPGGKAAYPSTVLMNVLPARVARVREIVMVTPPPRDGCWNPAVLGAAYLAGVHEVYQVGGAQAVAALAFGTRTIRRVDKVVGPGNIYVTTAKKLLYGVIDIDALAGESEIMILADRTADPRYVAADMISQAEHDENAQAVAVLIGRFDEAQLNRELNRQRQKAVRHEIVNKSLQRHGVIITVDSRDAAVDVANLKAPEHLEIITRRPAQLARAIHNVGTIFLGPWTPEPMGDYIAGPNHTLPTGATARFFSPLSVLDFMKMSNVVQFRRKAFNKLCEAVITLAESEGFYGHAQSVRIRKKS